MEHTPDAPVIESTPMPASRPARLLTLWAFMSLILASCAGLYYVGYSLAWPRYERLLADITELKQAAQVNQLRLDHLNSDLSRVAEPGRIEALQAGFKSLEGRLASLTTEGIKYGVVTEVAYLVRTAERFLVEEFDVARALQLLEMADKSLANLNEADVIPIRASLATDRARLKALQVPDVQALWFRVTGLMSRLSQLPRRVLPQSIQVEGPSETASPIAEPWRVRLNHAYEEIKGLIRLRKHESSLQTLIEPMEQALVEERLSLILESCRYTIARQQEMRFHELLNEALSLLERNYDDKAGSVQHTVAELKALNEVKLSCDLPDLGPTQAHLSQLLGGMKL